MLNDDEWSQWSDSDITRRCRVSQPFIAKLRPEAIFKPFEDRPRSVKRGDTVYQQNTSNIGRKPTPQLRPAA
jgi:hypothetical protein